MMATTWLCVEVRESQFCRSCGNFAASDTSENVRFVDTQEGATRIGARSFPFASFFLDPQYFEWAGVIAFATANRIFGRCK